MTDLPLFPLQTVLFPGGLLPLKVFEARYLDLISHCLRTREPFAVVRIRQGAELAGAADAPQPGETAYAWWPSSAASIVAA
mgnify:CR=1 FL=1